MIEIIKEEVPMPPLKEQRYQYGKLSLGRGKWEVIDTMDGDKVVFRSEYQSAALAKHSLNKKYYRDKNKSL